MILDAGAVAAAELEAGELVAERYRVVARIGEDYRPALGFVSRTGVYEYQGNARYRWRPNGPIRRIDFGVDLEVFTDLDGDLESQSIELPYFAIENSQGDGFEGKISHNRENLTEPFEISRGVIIPVGDYAFPRFQISGYTAAARLVSARARFDALAISHMIGSANCFRGEACSIISCSMGSAPSMAAASWRERLIRQRR
jgi:hypothetical protein